MRTSEHILLKTFIITVILTSALLVSGQRQSTKEYIEKWDEVAVQQMHDHGIPASITLAQGILESGSGNSELSKKSNNHFGIKCGSNWKGKSVRYDDDRKRECFRKYPNAAQSFYDHSDFLKRDRYARLFELKTTDYKNWAKGLKKAGYATDPKYPHKLIDLIEKYDLAQYDKMPPGPLVDPNAPVLASTQPVFEGMDDTEIVVDMRQRHQVALHKNNIKFVTVKKGDTYYGIAEEFEMATWQIYRYNDLSENIPLHPGDVIFLQPKRSKAQNSKHIVKTGESLRDISQEHGIKLKKLCKYNGITPSHSPKSGDELQLKRS